MPEETLRVQGHLCECQHCKELVEEFNKIMLFDLPSIAVLRSEELVLEDPDSISESALLERIRARAELTPPHSEELPQLEDGTGPSLSAVQPMRIFRVAGVTALAAGWLVAAVLILVHSGAQTERTRAVSAAVLRKNLDGQMLKTEAANLTKALQAANAKVNILNSRIDKMSNHVHTERFEMIHLTTQYQDLKGSYSDLSARLTNEQALLAQESAELQLTRDSLNSQISVKDSLEVQLSEVYSRFDKQGDEVTKLEHAANAVPVAYPVSESSVNEGEAREILGARDLHIVDVYDVDGSGNATRTYGRIYYVNHRLLIFYAFDLSRLEKTRKLVAFQAWGFQQPRSSKVESLGLFYLDNATLNRWALRVSNPEILSRIDTLFVTMEPPGGSRYPKGRRLLMASLVGPPNHP